MTEYTPEKVDDLVEKLIAHRSVMPWLGVPAAALAAVSAERDAYKRAKAENDERFMIERDEARADRDRLHKAITEEIDYLEGFRPDHAEHIMLLAGESLDRLRAALDKEGNDDE